MCHRLTLSSNLLKLTLNDASFVTWHKWFAIFAIDMEIVQIRQWSVLHVAHNTCTAVIVDTVGDKVGVHERPKIVFWFFIPVYVFAWILARVSFCSFQTTLNIILSCYRVKSQMTSRKLFKMKTQKECQFF